MDHITAQLKQGITKKTELENYTSINNPASLKHFTLVLLGNRCRNSSQCKIEARPPAEHPERRA